jgi:hypothetical protein
LVSGCGTRGVVVAVRALEELLEARATGFVFGGA